MWAVEVKFCRRKCRVKIISLANFNAQFSIQ